MQYSTQSRRIRASATDLANHARCEHLTQLARARATAIAEGRETRAQRQGLAIDKGRAFEAAWVADARAAVEARGGRFLDVQAAAQGDPRRCRELLARAITDGIELIAQAPLRAGDLFGFADLLERIDDADAPAGTLRTVHRYVPVEIKYAHSVRAEHVLQASAYADALGELQGELPPRMYVVCGDRRRHELVTSEYVEYFRAARERLAAALALDLDAELARVPDPVAWCPSCEFLAACDRARRSVDHLSLVARMRRDQRAKLLAAGIETLTELATTELDRVPGIGRATLAQLRAQAGLQLAAREEGHVGVSFRQPADDEPSGRGFALLPEPDPDDIFFDFEGYPYHDSGALEYLWGWTTRDADGQLHFDHLWADDPDAEAAAFSAFLDEVHARRERSPSMHVYHYAPYEVTALRRLARQNPHETERLDQLLRAGVFVDLYAVVRQALLVGTESYSIKQLEPLYGVDRSDDELADGGASIEVYERWLLQGDEQVRDMIVAYNRVDCDSTLLLRDWLLEQRDAATAQGIHWPAPPAHGSDDEAEPVEPDQPDDHPAAELARRLERLAGDEDQPDDVRLAARLLSVMPGWERRVKREFFGELHARRRDRDVEDYLDEPTALAGLELLDQEPTGKPGTVLRRFRYPDQVTLVGDGQTALDATTLDTVGSVEWIDLDQQVVAIRTTAGQQQRRDERAAARGDAAGQLPRAIVGWKDIRVTTLQTVAAQVGERLLDAVADGHDPFAADEPHAAVLSVLARHAPRVRHGAEPEAIALPPDPDELAELVQRLPGSHLVVQGPPGTGKTWTSARLIAALVEAGLRVGVSSNSHAAVVNVLRGIDELRRERAGGPRAVTLRAAYALRTGEAAPGSFGFGSEWIERPRRTADAAALLEAGEVEVIAGTAWQLAKVGSLDVVLVDEAGQVSLLHVTALGACARTMVLVGDPQQLPQPAGTMHPHGCGASVLEHLFGGEPVLPPDRAVLLPVTRRMHPRVTSFISDTYYAGRLEPHPTTAEQHVAARGVPSAGLHLVEVAHDGNRVRSDEEVAAIERLVRELLDSGRTVARPGEPERSLRHDDIIVVAPYNAQRRALQAELGPHVAVGTVDRFQGQEAPVAILSLTASSRDELPRGLEFLLDPHRLNVAVSRARSLAIVVASPSLLATSAGSLREMRLLNDLARLTRVAHDR